MNLSQTVASASHTGHCHRRSHKKQHHRCFQQLLESPLTQGTDSNDKFCNTIESPLIKNDFNNLQLLFASQPNPKISHHETLLSHCLTSQYFIQNFYLTN